MIPEHILSETEKCMYIIEDKIPLKELMKERD